MPTSKARLQVILGDEAAAIQGGDIADFKIAALLQLVEDLSKNP